MQRLMPELSSDSSSESDSSDDSDYEDESKPLSLKDLISWNSIEGNLTNFSETFKQFSLDEKLFLLRSRCLSKYCTCNFKTHNLLLARVFVGLKVLVGKWCKLRFAKSAVPDTEKLATFIFFKNFQGWYEIMNENLEVIPFWNNVSHIIQNKPKQFILRRDTKCMYLKDSKEDVSKPVVFDTVTLKGGIILSFSQHGKYLVKKGRRVKEQFLVKCKDDKDNFYYFLPDETVYASPIAGFDNISGAHSFQSIIEKFHFPINVKSIFLTPPLPNLSCSDRHFMQLSDCYQMDLLIVTHIDDSNRLFLLTPNLLNDHVFTIGEFLPESVTKQTLPADVSHHISIYQTKITDFYCKCHKYENLSYLLKPSDIISKMTQKFEYTESEFDDIYNEIDGIYFFVRNGYFPKDNAPKKSTTDANPMTIVTEIASTTKSEVSSTSNQTDSIDDDESTEMSSTSTESDKTSSTALEMFRKQRNMQAKSMPLSKNKNTPKNCQFNLTNSHCHLNLTLEDTMNLTTSEVCLPPEVAESEQSNAAHSELKSNRVRPKDGINEITSLKDTMV